MSFASRFRAAGICAASLALLAAAPQSPAPADFYLSVAGITPPGAPPAGGISVLSYAIGLGGIAAGGALSASPLQFSKLLDSTTPKFLSYFNTGMTLPDPTVLYVKTNDAAQKTIATFELHDVKVVGDVPAGDSNGPSEKITLAYTYLRFCTPASNHCVAYNFKTGTAGGVEAKEGAR